MTQACATLFTDAYKPKPGFISQTFTATSASIHAGLAIVKEVLDGGYLGEDGKIMGFHKHFVGHLQRIAQQHPAWLQGPFGLGTMIGFSVLDGSEKTAKEFLQQLFKNGVLAFGAGHTPSRIRFLIPVGGVTFADIDQVCQIIERTLSEIAQITKGH